MAEQLCYNSTKIQISTDQIAFIWAMHLAQSLKMVGYGVGKGSTISTYFQHKNHAASWELVRSHQQDQKSEA